ncbi:MAG: transcriptional regulator NrdR [Vicinamibacteria bacterium]
MKCPFCGHLADKVVDSRESKEGEAIRRRRQCLKCGRRFTSYERLDRIDYRVVKKDGRRERFDREKLMSGILKACEKRAVPVTRLEAIVDQVEQRLHDSPDKELATTQIGEFVMSELKSLDQVAYVRFASVYRDFKDAHEFVETIRSLLGRQDLSLGGD